MSIVLWVLQGILAAVFLGAGLVKLARSKQQLAAMGPSMAWADDFSDSLIKVIGIAEVLAALGLVLPGLLGVATVLTPLAGLGLIALMLGAGITHLRRRETSTAAANLLICLLALVVVIARFGPLPL
jgi:uncharacterized membrane protein YphA (DoxX/SURF4 family)